jgi:hypothetical protein
VTDEIYEWTIGTLAWAYFLWVTFRILFDHLFDGGDDHGA